MANLFIMRIFGPSKFIVVAASVYLGYWVLRVLAEPEASLEVPVVLAFSAPIIWRLLRVGIWVNEDQVVLKNMWNTVRCRPEEARLVAGHLDELSEFDRFTGGQSRAYRRKLEDYAAEERLLRHRLVIDGKQHEIDAMMGRTPRAQREAAERLRNALGINLVGC